MPVEDGKTEYEATITGLEAAVEYRLLQIWLVNENQDRNTAACRSDTVPYTFGKTSREKAYDDACGTTMYDVKRVTDMKTVDFVPEGAPATVIVDTENEDREKLHRGITVYWSDISEAKDTFSLRNGDVWAWQITYWQDRPGYESKQCSARNKCQKVFCKKSSAEVTPANNKQGVDHKYIIGGPDRPDDILEAYTNYTVEVQTRTVYGDDSSACTCTDCWGPASTSSGRTLSGVPPRPQITNIVATALKNNYGAPDWKTWKVLEEASTQTDKSAGATVFYELDDLNGPVTNLWLYVQREGLGDSKCTNGVTDAFEEGLDCGGECFESPCEDYRPGFRSVDNAYINNLKVTQASDIKNIFALDVDKTNFTVEDLDPDNSYGYRLIAATADGQWSVSKALDQMTQDEQEQVLAMSKTTAIVVPKKPVGGTVGAVLVILILAGVAVVMWKRQKEAREASVKDSIRNHRADSRAKGPANGYSKPKPSQTRNEDGGEPDADGDLYDAVEESADLGSKPMGSDHGLNIPPVPKLAPVDFHEVPTGELNSVIAQMSANSDFAFSEEYECLEQGNEFSREASQVYTNKVKNRYANILPYDYSRVRLSLIPGDQYSDYINANYIDGFGKSRKRHYIAAQGPTPQTLGDFWRMLWEAEVEVIVMVTNCEEKGRIKCKQYWPDPNEDELGLPNGLRVGLVDQKDFPNYIVRKLRVRTPNGKSKILTQYHYISWPDHGVPESTEGTMGMLKKCKATRSPDGGPMLVHCSAGVGRTGTLIAIDINLDRNEAKGIVDVYGTLNSMRRQRSTMVQTEEQYIFIYQSLADAIANVQTELTSKELREHVAKLRLPMADGSSVVANEFKQLNSTPGVAHPRTDNAQIPINKPKNRFQNILPYENTRVKLQAIPGVTGSDYINANFIDSMRQRGAYIATQGPKEETVVDFWRMIWEREVDVVVMLTELVENNRAKSEQYWPEADEQHLNFGDFQIVFVSETATAYGHERSLQLVDVTSESQRDIKQFQFTKWPTAKQAADAGSPGLIAMHRAMVKYQGSKVVVPASDIYGNADAIQEHAMLKQIKPVVIHCGQGVGRTGAFIAILVEMERLAAEDTVDLFSAIRHMRTQRMTMVQTLEQYEFIYRTLIAHLDAGPAPSVTSFAGASAATEEMPVYGNVSQPARRTPRAAPALPAEVDDDDDIDFGGGAPAPPPKQAAVDSVAADSSPEPPTPEPSPAPAPGLDLDVGLDLDLDIGIDVDVDGAPPELPSKGVSLDPASPGPDPANSLYEIDYNEDGDEYGLSI